MSRMMAVLIALSLTTASSAHALSLRWSEAGRNLHTTVARSCTLLVQSGSPEEALPEDWHLLWVGRSDAATALSIDVVSADDEYADVCDLRRASSATSTTARADTAIHCSSTSSRKGVA